VREAADRDGESLITLGPAPVDELDGFADRLRQVAETVACACTVIHTVDAPVKDGADGKGGGKATGANGDGRAEAGVDPAQDATSGRDVPPLGIDRPSASGPCDARRDSVPLRTMYCMVRKLPAEGHHLDLRVAVVGNVDAGKSTLVGVLTGPVAFLDDGRGLARSRVLRHKHEAETGRTSSIAEDQHMRLRCPAVCKDNQTPSNRMRFFSARRQEPPGIELPWPPRKRSVQIVGFALSLLSLL
jgi:hypothetical protein